MKKVLQILLLGLATVLLAPGCTDSGYEFDETMEDQFLCQDPTRGAAAKLPADYYFDAQSQVWLQPVPDPYTLDNFQRALEIVYAESAKTSMSAKASRVPTLRPTHYNVKIWPRTEAEKERIWLDEDLSVSHFPFDSRPLNLEEKQKLSLDTATKAAAPVKYYETLEDVYQGSEYVGEVRIPMPVIYAVWPCSKPFPEDMDYEVLYEVFLPDDAPELKAQQLDIAPESLTKAAISLAQGKDPAIVSKATSFGPAFYPSGRLTYWDAGISRVMPLVHLKIVVRCGSRNIYEGYTNEMGYYESTSKVYPDDGAVVYIKWETDRWYIAGYDVNTYSFMALRDNNATLGDIKLAAMHEALRFWFAGNHELTKKVRVHNGDRIKVEDDRTPNPTASGRYSWSLNYGSIKIYYQPYNRSIKGFFSTLSHELGHASMHAHKRYQRYLDTGIMIKEGWASFTGWHVTNEYYKRYETNPRRCFLPKTILPGYCYECSNPKIYPSHTHQVCYFMEDLVEYKKQVWRSDQAFQREYSPLFIDLRDDFNQREYQWGLGNEDWGKYPNDNIANMPINLIEAIAFNSYAYESFEKEMYKHIDHSFTFSQFIDYIARYYVGWV